MYLPLVLLWALFWPTDRGSQAPLMVRMLTEHYTYTSICRLGRLLPHHIVTLFVRKTYAHAVHPLSDIAMSMLSEVLQLPHLYVWVGRHTTAVAPRGYIGLLTPSALSFSLHFLGHCVYDSEWAGVLLLVLVLVRRSRGMEEITNFLCHPFHLQPRPQSHNVHPSTT